MLVALAIWAAFLGAALGSYAGVLRARGLRASLDGRSHCDACGTTLRWFEVVPLISYPALHGHCRSCRARVGIAVYAWELGGAVVGVTFAIAFALTGAIHSL